MGGGGYGCRDRARIDPRFIATSRNKTENHHKNGGEGCSGSSTHSPAHATSGMFQAADMNTDLHGRGRRLELAGQNPRSPARWSSRQHPRGSSKAVRHSIRAGRATGRSRSSPQTQSSPQTGSSPQRGRSTRPSPDSEEPGAPPAQKGIWLPGIAPARWPSSSATTDRRNRRHAIPGLSAGGSPRQDGRHRAAHRSPGRRVPRPRSRGRAEPRR